MRRILTAENFAILVMVVVGLCVVIIMDRIGMPQRWHAAIAGTEVTFGGVILVYQRKWSFWTF